MARFFWVRESCFHRFQFSVYKLTKEGYIFSVEIDFAKQHLDYVSSRKAFEEWGYSNKCADIL